MNDLTVAHKCWAYKVGLDGVTDDIWTFAKLVYLEKILLRKTESLD